jgi:Lipocalin-like domain
MKKVLLFAAVAALAFSACKKSGGSDAKAVTKENIIGNYKLTSMTVSLNGGAETDAKASMDDCQKDDIYLFKAADVYELSDAGLQCDPNSGYISTWTLSGDTIESDGQASKVTSLTSTQMQTTSTFSDVPGMTAVTKSTFTRQ